MWAHNDLSMSEFHGALSVGATYSSLIFDAAEKLGPLNIDYIHLYKCEFKNFEFLFIFLVVIWIVILIDVLGKTASEYFTPTLASISIKWKLSDNFAGVTLVALANGAPDIFSSVIGLTTTGSADVSIGALLGGGLFVCTVVVGSIAVLSPCKLSGLYFTRDSLFLLITVITLALLGAHEKITLFSALSLCGIYFTYILLVLITPCLESYQTKYLCDQNIKPTTNSVLTDIFSSIRMVFWAQEHTDNCGEFIDENGIRESKDTIPCSQFKVSSSDDADSINLSGQEVDEYRFLIIDDFNQRDISGQDLNGRTGRLHRGNLAADGNEIVTNNLPGGILGKFFGGNIINECFSLRNLNSIFRNTPEFSFEKGEPTISKEMKKCEISKMKRSSSKNYDVETSLVDPILSIEESIENKDEDGFEFNQTSFTFGSTVGTRNCSGICTKLVALSLRRRFMKRIGRDWNEVTLAEKIVFVIEYPFVMARDLTIPTLDCELWCRKSAAIQPFLCCLFLLFLAGGAQSMLNLGAVTAYLSVLTMAPFFYTFFLSHYSHPPSDGIFVHLWLFFGFIMCVSWIYLLAGELVYCLTSVGTVFNIPRYYLALTVLAWGNSIGDLFSNVSVAKKGMGEMAIAGCYGGPVFNILMGMGISLTFVCYRDYPHPYILVLDHSAVVSIGFFCAVLVCSICFASFLKFRLNALMGYFLITSYILYTVIQTMIAISEN